MIALIVAALIRLLFSVGSGRCDALIAERNTGAGWTNATLYADRAFTVKRPRVAESDTSYVDSAFVSVTQSGAGTSLRCKCLGGELVNVVAVVPAGSFPRDTTLYAFFARTPNVPARLGGGSTEARWVGARGDTAAAIVMTLDYEQSTNRVAHCRACGYWWLRGVRQVCP